MSCNMVWTAADGDCDGSSTRHGHFPSERERGSDYGDRLPAPVLSDVGAEPEERDACRTGGLRIPAVDGEVARIRWGDQPLGLLPGVVYADGGLCRRDLTHPAICLGCDPDHPPRRHRQDGFND